MRSLPVSSSVILAPASAISVPSREVTRAYAAFRLLRTAACGMRRSPGTRAASAVPSSPILWRTRTMGSARSTTRTTSSTTPDCVTVGGDMMRRSPSDTPTSVHIARPSGAMTEISFIGVIAKAVSRIAWM